MENLTVHEVGVLMIILAVALCILADKITWSLPKSKQNDSQVSDLQGQIIQELRDEIELLKAGTQEGNGKNNVPQDLEFLAGIGKKALRKEQLLYND